MAIFATNVSGAILLPSSIQVMESISGSVVPLAMFIFEIACQEGPPQDKRCYNRDYNGKIFKNCFLAIKSARSALQCSS